MGQTEHRAWKKMKEAQDKVKRNPSSSYYKEKAKDAEIEWYKAKEEEKEEEEKIKKIDWYWD